MRITKARKAVSLTECPIGLFILKEYNELCVKTEYGNNEGGIDCYIVSSGEFLSCEGRTIDAGGCDTIMVYPVTVKGRKLI